MEFILYLLARYKYPIIFPLAVVEGPILSVICGFLSSVKYLHPLMAYSIIVAGDIVGDSFYYFLGRLGNAPFLQKTIHWLGLTPVRLQRVKSFIDANPYKTISLSKIVLGVGVAGLFLAGKSQLPYLRFLGICLLTSFFTCGGYFCLGFFFGKAYEQINHYLNYFASLCIVAALALALFVFIRLKVKKNMG